tara:strand:+ start:2207 stop:2878 length:672 start_codon:yes stop_codon:yes gene_type:complete
LKKDNWLSKQLKYEVKSLDKKDLINLNFKNFKTKTLLYCKVGQDFKINKKLLSNKFILVEKNLLFKKKINQINFECSKIREAQPRDKKEVCEIAKKSFINSRFYKDRHISNSIAAKIKFNWVKNYFSGKRGDRMIVYSEKKKVIGFVMLINKKKNLIIDLIAVKKKFRKKNIASKFIRFICNTSKNKHYIYAGTQQENFQSIKFYKKNKFIIAKNINVYHKHI